MWKNKIHQLEDFVASEHVSNDVLFLILNPYDFPRPRALLDVYLLPSKEMLDIVEQKIIQIQEDYKNKSIVIITHYPVNQFGSSKSGSGRTFEQMTSEYNIPLVITGHKHPKNLMPQHHDMSLEIICSDIRDNHHIGILTNDNRNFFYHQYSIYERPTFVVTYPIDAKQLSMNTMFNKNDIDVRCLVFSDSENETITCNGKPLSFQRHIKEGVSLYHREMRFENGFSTLNFSKSNESYSYEIFVGDEMPSYYEVIGDEHEIYKYPLYVLIFIYIILFIITFPVNVEKHFGSLQNYANKSLYYLYNRNKDYRILDHLFYISQGFLLTRWQLLRRSQ
ncbi:hypothetical protein TVAG_219620 [Trichomonas vaginalis G3]|uniref:Calcineurin-like phosphoesterase domain-containing protein n=1 Tax=Trichomonas vaginalis (strain ATCC PRA-98 / G3) TaxID=412133 RepID=A2DXS1_TRIV3|nr:calcineurin-like phosphoesterase family [Trichomonas vaginalis G3]EAY14781.1 hypothetical protein TVAG_219620 [Trichomonas vaginalis G3]KAI5508055.1 calcineurin-like phosphoesterase family [Trichomonas vaginalis G3]|eukprot:XP_001327004.1 hypothetical protein [Trichomonas vaginalis G3]